ncbi:hypothetical protein ACSBR2_026985 [Camellia fascicularis]
MDSRFSVFFVLSLFDSAMIDDHQPFMRFYICVESNEVLDKAIMSLIDLGHFIRICFVENDVRGSIIKYTFHVVFSADTRTSLSRPQLTGQIPQFLYEILETIGHGSFGCVYKAHKRDTNEIVALKMIYSIDDGDEGVPSSVIREVSYLKEMDHSNIVRLLDVLDDDKILCLVLEYMDLDLKKFMTTSADIAKKNQVIKSLMHQLLDGLAYCHSQKLLHRDLKPQNLLIDCSKHILKLADFGSAREIGVPLQTYTEGEKVASLWYKAPELLLGGQKYSTPVDIWSAGCVFAELVIQQPLFDGATDFVQVIKVFSIMGKPNEETWPGVTSICDFLDSFASSEPQNLAEVVPGLEPAGLDLLSKMLCMNPEGRISASEALGHPYFDDIENP